MATANLPNVVNAWRLQGLSVDALALLSGAESMRAVVRRSPDVLHESNHYGEGIHSIIFPQSRKDVLALDYGQENA